MRKFNTYPSWVQEVVLKLEREINGRRHIGWDDEVEDDIQEEIRSSLAEIIINSVTSKI